SVWSRPMTSILRGGTAPGRNSGTSATLTSAAADAVVRVQATAAPASVCPSFRPCCMAGSSRDPSCFASAPISRLQNRDGVRRAAYAVRGHAIKAHLRQRTEAHAAAFGRQGRKLLDHEPGSRGHPFDDVVGELTTVRIPFPAAPEVRPAGVLLNLQQAVRAGERR